MYQLPFQSHLPEQLAPLRELIINMRWSWHQPTQDLFDSIGGRSWRLGGEDPTRLLQVSNSHRFRSVAGNRRMLVRVHALAMELDHYLRRPRWYQLAREVNPYLPTAVAYLSAEFDLHGMRADVSGLGIQVGDHLKAASDLGLPLIAVSLQYRDEADSAGHTPDRAFRAGSGPQHSYPLPAQLLLDATGQPKLVYVDLADGRTLWAQIWQVAVGRIPLLVLDPDIAKNESDLREITRYRYRERTEHRLHQALLIGVGGVRAVRAYCQETGHPQPTVFHDNGDRTTLSTLERIRQLMSSNGQPADQAAATVQASTVFTTHVLARSETPRFFRDITSDYLDTALHGQLRLDQLTDLDQDVDSDFIDLTRLGFQTARRSNALSRSHGKNCRSAFASLWPDQEPKEVPIGSVTPGVHAPSWEAPEVAALMQRTGEDENDQIGGKLTLPDRQLWQLRLTLRARLIREARQRLHSISSYRVLDPEILTVGYIYQPDAYRTLELLLWQPEWLRSLLLDSTQPMQVIIAGQVAKGDDVGEQLVHEMTEFCTDKAIDSRIVFLPDRDLTLARLLCTGADVWLNDPPSRPWASSAFGMRAAVNGALNLSPRRGWWREYHDGDVGWVANASDQADDQALALYFTIAQRVLPAYHQRDPTGMPKVWLNMVRRTLLKLRPEVQASRMVAEYVNDWYGPAAQKSAAVEAQAEQPS